MRVRNKPSPMSVFLSRADELEAKFGYARISRRMRDYLRDKKRFNNAAIWMLVLAEKAASKEAGR